MGAITVLFAVLAFRLRVVGLGPTFASFGVGLLFSVLTVPAAFITLLVAWRVSEAARRAGLAAILSLVVVAVPAWTLVNGSGAPPIHHITTDVDDPPQFDAVIPLRGEGSNPLEYSPELAEVQRRAYPGIEPLFVPGTPTEVFERCVEVAQVLRWEIVSTDRAAGRIEATDTTFWFRFKDDVVIRVRAANQWTRVDLRSVSRIGGGDVGANAARIRAFAKRLVRRLDT